MTAKPSANTAVLVIDVQIGLVTGAYREQEVLGIIQRVITDVRVKGGLVVFIQHCHATFEPLMAGNPAWALHPSLKTEEADLVIEKTASDAFYQTPLDALLKERQIQHLLITGLQTEFCVDTTCRSALSHGYDVTLVSDAHTTGDAHIPAPEIVEHHNKILANVAHPDQQIDVKSSNAL